MKFIGGLGAFATRVMDEARFNVVAWMCLLAVFAGAPAGAQSTFGSVRGIVQIRRMRVSPGAQVALHNMDENTERTVTADAAGAFVFENVKAGQYQGYLACRWVRGLDLLWRLRGGAAG